MRIEVIRGEVVESVHLVDAVVHHADHTVQAWGNGQKPVIPRSAIKFVQALPLLTTGAADRFAVTANELALACSSHSGEREHIEAVRAWLARMGVAESDLACGPDAPLGSAAAQAFYRAGAEPSAIYNCCSGKHAGFLAVASQLGVDPTGYIEPDHPVQREVHACVERLTGLDLSEQSPGRDGCGIPVYAIPLTGLALAMNRLVNPDCLPADLAGAANSVVEAVLGREFWLSGTDRHEMILGVGATEPVIAKTGAEGVFMASLPERGIGVAVKAADGATRAGDVAISAVLSWLGAYPADKVDQPLRNKAGVTVGRITAVIDEPKTV